MQAEQPDTSPLVLPRIGVAIAGAALVCPVLALPLTLACIAGLGNLALREGRADNVVPELPSTERPRRSRARRNAEEGEEDKAGSTEDSFPASDPPSWTPITGPGTRH